MIDAAARRGYDLTGLRARQVRAADFGAFDLIVAMDCRNRADLEALRPAGNTTPVRLMLDHLAGSGPRDVPDPYYTRDFDAALDLIEAAAEGLLGQLEQNASAVSPKTE
jgi:protein-tyrosine phosphatase